MKNLPGIKAVGLLSRESLTTEMVYKSSAGVQIVLEEEPEWLCGIKDASCQWDEKFDNNSYYQTAKLSFTTSEKLETAGKIFVIETVEGEILVIGSDLPPYPVIQFTKSSGMPGSSSAGYSYEVTCTGIKAIIRANWA